ncbi:MAG: MoaD/ThiS family protein [Candidatus Bathyarchaeota archaeon]|nr:MoaD/ThiS family protein [Candidatus Bathyarchaeota archaeon]
MKVKVHYLGLVRTYMNKTQEDVELPDGALLYNLLDKLALEFGSPFNPEVYEPTKKEVKAMFMILVNGILMDQFNGVNTELKNGDTVMIMPLMTGG